MDKHKIGAIIVWLIVLVALSFLWHKAYLEDEQAWRDYERMRKVIFDTPPPAPFFHTVIFMIALDLMVIGTTWFVLRGTRQEQMEVKDDEK